MTDIDPNLWASLAKEYTGGIAAPVAGQAGYAVRVNSDSNNLEYTRQDVSEDNGDADATLVAGTSAMLQRWDTPLTAARAAALSTTGAVNGSMFWIIRTANATGAYDLNVGTGPLKALGIGAWCVVAFDGTAWFVCAGGNL